MELTLEKLAIPLTITASVLGIALYLRAPSSPAVPVTGALPLPAPTGSWSGIPVSPGNPATTPSPVPGTGVIPLATPIGLTVNNGLGAPIDPSADAFSLGAGSGCDSGCGCGGGSTPSLATPYFLTTSQSAAL